MIILFHYPLPRAPCSGLPQSASCLLRAVDLATAATPMAVAAVVDAATAAAEASLAQQNPVAAQQFSEDVRAAARVASVTATAILSSQARGSAPGRMRADGRRKRTGMSLGTKLQIAAWKKGGKS